MRALLAGPLVALAMLAAAPATAQDPRRVDPSIADGSAKRALERARTRWRTARIGSRVADEESSYAIRRFARR